MNIMNKVVTILLALTFSTSAIATTAPADKAGDKKPGAVAGQQPETEKDKDQVKEEGTR